MELAVIPVLRNVATCAVAVLALLLRGGCLFLPATHIIQGEKKNGLPQTHFVVRVFSSRLRTGFSEVVFSTPYYTGRKKITSLKRTLGAGVF